MNSWINACAATKKPLEKESERKRELCLYCGCTSPVPPLLPKPVTWMRKRQVDNLLFSEPKRLHASVPALASSHTMNVSFIPGFPRGQWEHTLPVHYNIWCSLALLAAYTDSFSPVKWAKIPTLQVHTAQVNGSGEGSHARHLLHTVPTHCYELSGSANHLAKLF